MANQAVYSTQILRYPYAALTDETDYLQIDVLNYTRNNPNLVSERGTFRSSSPAPGQPLNGRDNSKVDSFNTVFLPMPSNIQDGNSVKYADDTLNGIVAQAVQGTTAIMTAQGSGGVTSMVNQTLKEMQTQFGSFFDKSGGAAKDLIIRALAAQSVNIFGGNVTPDQILARQSGEIFNPNMELLFNGVTLRTFKFSFKMTPRNNKESAEVKQIIRLLKTKMAPKYVNTTYLKTPDIFQLTYKKGSGEHPFLHRFKKCALTDMAVNYTGENIYATYGDATPVSMIMDLTFRELEPIYAQDYTDDIGGVGY